MDTDNHRSRIAVLAYAVAAAAMTTALAPLLANPAHAQPAAAPARAAPAAISSAVPAKLTLPSAGASLPPVNASLPPVPAPPVPVTTKLPTTAVSLPPVKASPPKLSTSPGPVKVSVPPVGVSVGPIHTTPGPVTVSPPPVSGPLASAATPAPVDNSGRSGPNGAQTRGPFPPPPLASKPHTGDTPAAAPDTSPAHGLDGLLAALLNPNGPGAALAPDLGLPQIPGVGSSGVLGRQSVTSPALSESLPAMPRVQVVLAVLAILALSIVTAAYARRVLLRKRHAG